MEVYTVVRVGWEYNDEYYEEINGNNPLEAYKERSNAETKCLELNLAKYKEVMQSSWACFGDYVPDYDTITTSNEKQYLKSLGVMLDTNECPYIPVTTTDEAIIKIMITLSVVFYMVTPIPYME